MLVDAAAYLPTHPLNLTETPADAVDISFYKVREIVVFSSRGRKFWRCSRGTEAALS